MPSLEGFVQALLAHGATMQVWLFFASLLGLALMERRIPVRAPSHWRSPRWRTNWGLAMLSIAMMSLVPLSFVGAALLAEERGWGALNLLAPAWPLAVLVSLLARAFISFGTHWAFHRVPWLWRLHRVHHMDTELDVSATLRFHPLETLVTPLFGIPVVLALGLTPWVLVLYELLDACVTVFGHANVRLPARFERWLGYLLVTPTVHRVHHSSKQEETNSNYGAVFPFWDLVFRTYRARADAPAARIRLGLAEVPAERAEQIGWLLWSPFRRIAASPHAALPTHS